MPYHNWNEKDFDWKSLYKAEEEIKDILKWGRVHVYSKEKYGTIRWEIHLFDGYLHSLTHPGCVYSKYPKWLWCFDLNYKPLKFLVKPIQWLQLKIIKYAFKKICSKYPHIVKEIVCDAEDWYLPDDLAKIRNSIWIKSFK